MEKLDYLLIIMIIGLLALGWFSHSIYLSYTVKYRGMWIDANITEQKALDLVTDYDSKGDWICVNINGISVQEMISTCEHEAAHEIFAEKCESNISECLDLIK